MRKTNEEKVKIVNDVFTKNNATFNEMDCFWMVAIVDKWQDQGYKIGFEEAAQFPFAENNRDLIAKNGITKTIKAMARMKLIGEVKPMQRNQICHCKSGLKFKKCCLDKS
jgi:uncharacterized protein YchJ